MREYEKDFGGLPVQVGVYDIEVSFSAPYWDGLGAVLPDLRKDVTELADAPSLAVYDPQREEWGGDEERT
ncbi:hypothetical protein DAETH_12950 [Deinococcus aetherius]|uniref:Uncharacterized protein n=1 Tax=Deinococcus aetherius TaxID=200252 RepID=A0ABN6RDE0_9DEIO|nr:hypothetical protein DAETH_12950 [Deinococcus aetherius]